MAETYYTEIYLEDPRTRTDPEIYEDGHHYGAAAQEAAQDALDAALDAAEGLLDPGTVLYARATAEEGEPWLTDVLTATVPEPPVTCQCSCGCTEDATTTDESVHLCDDCEDYYADTGGEVVCSREQSSADACRHCGQDIDWGTIQTGSPGQANHISGRCGCREWTQTEHGGSWQLSEGD